MNKHVIFINIMNIYWTYKPINENVDTYSVLFNVTDLFIITNTKL